MDNNSINNTKDNTNNNSKLLESNINEEKTQIDNKLNEKLDNQKTDDIQKKEEEKKEEEKPKNEEEPKKEENQKIEEEPKKEENQKIEEDPKKEENQKIDNNINEIKENINEKKENIIEEPKKESKIEIKKEEKEEEELEEKEEPTNEYIIRCDKCFLVPLIKIDHTTYKIHSQCENNHIKSDISIAQALNESKKISMKVCSNCNEKSEEDNYFCLQCQKVFCLDGGCKKKHSKEQPSHKLININTLDYTCFEHSTSFSKYCSDCKKNICIKCQRVSHGEHQLIDLGEILPLNDEIEKAKKLFELKKRKLLELKKIVNEWLKELNEKINCLLDSIDAEIIINRNILKNFKNDLMNYQMIENFHYFSDKDSLNFYTNKELMSLLGEKSWLHQTFLITQILNNLSQPIKINEENSKEVKTPTPNGTVKNISPTKIPKNKTFNNVNYDFLTKSNTIRYSDNKEFDKKTNSILANKLKAVKTFSAPISLTPQNLEKDYYWTLNECKYVNVTKKAFKSNLEITENIYSALIDNKGIIFLGGDSCLNIYRFDLKTNKIEKEFTVKGLDGAVNTINEIKENYLIVGTRNGTIKIIEFLGNKKYRINQEIRNQDKDSIYKIIELSNYYLMSCDEKNIILFQPKKNFYNICQEINLNTPTCCIAEIQKGIIAATHVVLKKISFYEIDKGKLNLKKEIENIDSTVNNNTIAIINDFTFCSVSQKNVYIYDSEKLELIKKVEIKNDTINLFPISFGMVLFCHYKENDNKKFDYILSLKTFDERNKNLLDIDQNIVNKNKDDEENIFYVNFFEPNSMIFISRKNISFWG